MSSKSSREARAERAAAALKERERAERRRRTFMVGGVVLVLLVVVAVGFLVTRSRDTSGHVAAPAAGEASGYGVAVGHRSARKKVVIYEDFLCPYCGELEKASHAELAKLADQGKAYVEYRPFDLLRTDYSLAAANAFKVVLDAAGPGVAKKFHDELYADQPAEAGPYPDADWLVQKAVDAGANEGDVRHGIEQQTEKAWVDRATAAASKAGVKGTPTVLVNGRPFTDGRTVDELATNLVATLR